MIHQIIGISFPTALILLVMVSPLFAGDTHPKGELIFEDSFNRTEPQETTDEPGNEWTTSSERTAAGQKQVDLRDGTLHFWTAEDANHDVSVRHAFEFTDGTIEMRFLLDEKKDSLRLNIADLAEKSVHAGHLMTVTLRPDSVTCADLKTGVMNLETRKAQKSKSLLPEQKKLLKTKSKSVSTSIKPGTWHHVVVHINGDETNVEVDGQKILSFRSPGFSHSPKTLLRMLTPVSATVDDVKIWREN
ncbi:LamG domain-containing protein [Calycomorphotria hydatis]|uniref:3-keto-disaccharide hydrolase domain-containing protein n=1 Tax=Calycomorphotria hydatis TaxID=2528027 RepID=A0A517TEI4_9PLAN|nr:hypothetical protein [Calycomorphotria hydatis]QDT66779.1 hypothetical protein V22_40500 [Calycomorphotria hydatis]